MSLSLSLGRGSLQGGREPRHTPAPGAEHFAAVCSWAERLGVFGSGGVEGSRGYWKQTDSS